MISRGALIATLFIFASLNGLVPLVRTSIDASGWDQAIFETLGVSVIVWGAWAAACYLALLEWDTGHIAARDVIVACIVFLFASLPVTMLSWLAVAFLSVYVLWTSPRGSLQWRSAAIFLAICAPMLWGPLLIAVWPTLLKIDAFLVSIILGTKHTGNAVGFLDGVHNLQVWPPCSSFHNVSQAGLAWIALRLTLHESLVFKDVFWAGLAMISAIAVNLGRLSLMAVSLDYYTALHSALGNQTVGSLTIAMIVLVCMIGQRREIFAHA